jgi:hypothetical protein
MEYLEALRIIKALVEGLDPTTGETCAADSIFQQAQTIRALERAAEALQGAVNREERKKMLPENVGKPWSASEDAQLCTEFDRGLGAWHISKIHGRTKGAITARLEKLGKLTPKLFETRDSPQSETDPQSLPALDKPWLPQEDKLLCAQFDRTHDFTVIATQVGRPRAEIYHRLVALGKIRPKARPNAA